MNGRTKILLTDWKAGRLKLLAKKTQLNFEYQKLKADVNKISKIRSNAHSILGVERRELQQSQAQKLPQQESMKDRLARAKKQADEYNASRTQTPKSKAYKDRGDR